MTISEFKSATFCYRSSNGLDLFFLCISSLNIFGLATQCMALSFASPLKWKSWMKTFWYAYGVRRRSRAKLCCRLISDSILRLFYFTPRSLVDVTSWTRKAPKELYEWRQQHIGDEDVFFYFPFISWIQQPFNGWGNFLWNTIEMLNPPVKVFKNTLIASWYMCALIWYFKALTMC